MSEETLLSAARRVVRFINIDNDHGGGLLSIETTSAALTLDKMIKLEEKKHAELRDYRDNPGNGDENGGG